jgi:hypothetical protein
LVHPRSFFGGTSVNLVGSFSTKINHNYRSTGDDDVFGSFG